MKKQTDGKPILSSRRSFGRRVIAGAPVLGAAFLTGTALAQDPEPDDLTTEQEEEQEAIESEVRSLVPPSSEKDQLNGLVGTGYVYRHNWGLRRGIWTLNLTWRVVRPNTLVFVSIGEALANPSQGKFIGGANFILYNVAPRDATVSIRININYDRSLPLLVDYLAITP